MGHSRQIEAEAANCARTSCRKRDEQKEAIADGGDKRVGQTFRHAQRPKGISELEH